MGKIDVHDFSTYPQELEKIRQCFNALLKKGEILNTDSYKNFTEFVRSLFDKKIDYPLKLICDEINLVLSNHEIVCFHNTRLISKEKILNEGIKFLRNGYLDYMQKILNEHLERQEVEEILKNIEEEISNKNDCYDKGKQICFYMNFDIHGQFCKFYEQFGGEVLEHAVRYNENHKQILSLGDPYIIKFFLPYSVLTRRRDDLITEILRYWLEIQKNIPKDTTYGFDGIINAEVPKKNILEIISLF